MQDFAGVFYAIQLTLTLGNGLSTSPPAGEAIVNCSKLAVGTLTWCSLVKATQTVLVLLLFPPKNLLGNTSALCFDQPCVLVCAAPPSAIRGSNPTHSTSFWVTLHQNVSLAAWWTSEGLTHRPISTVSHAAPRGNGPTPGVSHSACTLGHECPLKTKEISVYYTHSNCLNH